MNIMLLSVSVWSGAQGATRDLFHLLSAIIAIPTVAYSGRPFFRSAWAALRRGRTNMDVPISIGVILVTALSLFETLTGGPHAYFDGAVMLLFFLLVGRLLDSVMRDRARSGVADLLKQTAPGGRVVQADGSSVWMGGTPVEGRAADDRAAGERLAPMADRNGHEPDRSGAAHRRERAGDGRKAAWSIRHSQPRWAAPVRISAAGPDTFIADTRG